MRFVFRVPRGILTGIMSRAVRTISGYFNLGMTIIELLVITGVIAVLAAVTIGSLPRGNPRGYVRKEIEKLALDIRLAQNNGIIGKIDPLPPPSTHKGTGSLTPPYWGIHVQLNSQTDGVDNDKQYFLFADTNEDDIFRDNQDTYIAYRFENGIKVEDISSESGGGNEITFFFSVPYGDAFIKRGGGSVTTGGSFGTVCLSRVVPGGQIIRYNVTVRKSGQISITENASCL